MGRWKRAIAWINVSGWGNVFSVAALILSIYALYDTRRVAKRNDQVQLMQMKGVMSAAHGRTMENSGVASMKLMLITDGMSKECVAQRDAILSWLPQFAGLAEFSNSDVAKTWSDWLAVGKTLDDPEFDQGLPIAIQVTDWITDATDGELLSQRMLRFAEIIVEQCLAGRIPPPLPSDIAELMEKKRKAAPGNLQVK